MDLSRLIECWGGVKCKQYPDELARLLVYIYNNKHKINSYLEVGIENGGTFFVIDSFLRAVNPKYEGGYGVDVRYRRGSLNMILDYQMAYPDSYIKIVHANHVYEWTVPKTFDLCFIDAEHRYHAVLRDYTKYKPFSKIMAFHDIALPMREKSTSDLWEEIKTEDSIEILNEDDRFRTPVGIGILNP